MALEKSAIIGLVGTSLARHWLYPLTGHNPETALRLQVAIRSPRPQTESMLEARENVTTTEVTTVRPGYSVRAEQAVWLVAGVIDALLIIRFVFKLLAASTQASFVRFIYDITQLLVTPFHGIFNTAASGHLVFEPESLVAIAIYSLIGWGLASLIRVITRGRPGAA